MQNRELMLTLAGIELQDKLRANLMFNAKTINDKLLVEIQVPNCHTLDDIIDVDLATKGIRTKMAATISYIGLKGEWDVDPDLKLIIKAKVTLRTFGAGKNFYNNEFSFMGAQKKLSEWISNDGYFLRDEINRGVLSLADQVTNDLFISLSR
jgi:hypothetical protein